MLALQPPEAQLGNRGRRILQQAPFVVRIHPGSCDDLGAIHRSEIALIEIDDLVQRILVDEAFRYQHRFDPRHFLGQCLVVLGRTIAAAVRAGWSLAMRVVMLTHTAMGIAIGLGRDGSR